MRKKILNIIFIYSDYDFAVVENISFLSFLSPFLLPSLSLTLSFPPSLHSFIPFFFFLVLAIDLA